MTGRRLRAGDHVSVRSPEEILRTLDVDGTLDGLPFMPEMLEWCGHRFRVERRVEKTCVDAPVYPNRRFARNDVVVLEESRCDGEAHDGCRRGCKIFWKEAWLRPADSAGSARRPTPASKAALTELRRRLKTKADETRYFCQSTQLCKATEAFPGRKKPWMLRVIVREVLNGDRTVPEILKLAALWSWQRLQRAVRGRRWLRGPCTQTPTVSLGLRPGDLVRVKSRDEIVATLNDKRRNRGLGVCYEMTKLCGRSAEVRGRVDRLIDERTGRMRELRDTVTLLARRNGRPARDSECLCFNQLGDCPRGEMMYWREIWLERAEVTGRTTADRGGASVSGS